MNAPDSINGFDLIVAILHELERQKPGGMIAQHQFDVTTLACNAIADAMCGRSGTVLIETGDSHENDHAMTGQPAGGSSPTYRIGDWVKKRSGGSWRGKIVGWYRTSLTQEGYAVESAYEPGSVQIYPVTALEPWKPKSE